MNISLGGKKKKQWQARGGLPHLNIYRENTAISKGFREGHRWCLNCIHCTSDTLNPQPVSAFILKAQSVYVCTEIHFDATVPSLPLWFCPLFFGIFFFVKMATNLYDVFNHPTYFFYMHRFASRGQHCSIAEHTSSLFWSRGAPKLPVWPRQTRF